jgi:hypothetical protein
MSNGENQNGIFVCYPAIFGHIAELAARQDQLQAPVLGLAAKQRMVRKQLEGSSNADHPLTRELRIVFCEKIEKPFEIGERTSRYLDAPCDLSWASSRLLKSFAILGRARAHFRSIS